MKTPTLSDKGQDIQGATMFGITDVKSVLKQVMEDIEKREMNDISFYPSHIKKIKQILKDRAGKELI